MASNKNIIFDLGTTSDMVTFEGIKERYDPGEDIHVTYRVDRDRFQPTSSDWVGLYLGNWKDITDHVHSKWTPRKSKDKKAASFRSVVFKASEIKIDGSSEQVYQFLYVTRRKKIAGKSRQFRIDNIHPVLSKHSLQKLVGKNCPCCNIGNKDQRSTENAGNDVPNCTGSDVTTYTNPSVITTTKRKKETAIKRKLQEIVPYIDTNRHIVTTPPADLYSPDIVKIWNAAENTITARVRKNEDHTSLAGNFPMVSPPALLLDFLTRKHQDRNMWAVVPASKHKALVPYTPHPIFKLTRTIQKMLWKEPEIIIPYSPEACRIFEKSNSNIQNECSAIPLPPPVPPILASACQPDLLLHRDQQLHIPLCPLSADCQCKTLTSVKVRPSKVTQTKEKTERVIGKCLQCKRKQKLVIRLKEELSTCYKDIDKLKEEIKDTNNTLELKTLILEELSTRVRDLVHDNCELSATNERLNYARDDRLAQLSEQNRRLQARCGWATNKVLVLQQDNTTFRQEQESLDLQRRMMQTDIDVLRTRLSQKETEFASMKNHLTTVQQLSDDLMYTLALHGCSTLKDRNGNDINLETVEGKQLQIDGWKVVTNKRTGNVLAANEAKIRHLKKSNDNLMSQIEAMTQTLDDKMAIAQSLEDEKAKLQEKMKTIRRSLQNTEDHLSQLYDRDRYRKMPRLHRELNDCVSTKEQEKHKQEQGTKEKDTKITLAADETMPVTNDVWPEKCTVQTCTFPTCKSVSGHHCRNSSAHTSKVKRKASLSNATTAKSSAPKFVTDITTAFANLRALCSKLTGSMHQQRPQKKSSTQTKFENIELQNVNIQNLSPSTSSLTAYSKTALRDAPSAFADIHNLYPSTTSLKGSRFLQTDTPSALSDIHNLYNYEYKGKGLEDCPSGLSDVHHLFPSSTDVKQEPSFSRQASLHSVPSGKVSPVFSASELAKKLSELDSEIESLLRDVPSTYADIRGLYAEDQSLIPGNRQSGHNLSAKRSSHSKHLLRDVPSAIRDIERLYEAENDAINPADIPPCHQGPVRNIEECDPVYRRCPNWLCLDLQHRSGMQEHHDGTHFNQCDKFLLRPQPRIPTTSVHSKRGTALDKWTTPDTDLKTFWSDHLKRRLDETLDQCSQQSFALRFAEDTRMNSENKAEKEESSGVKVKTLKISQQEAGHNKQKRKGKKTKYGKKGKKGHKKNRLIWMQF